MLTDCLDKSHVKGINGTLFSSQFILLSESEFYPMHALWSYNMEMTVSFIYTTVHTPIMMIKLMCLRSVYYSHDLKIMLVNICNTVMLARGTVSISMETAN